MARGRDAREYESGEDFCERLSRFLPTLPTDEIDFVVEVRNGKWVGRKLVDLLAQHRVCMALTSYYTMPDIAEVRKKLLDPVSAGFLYVRFLGDRKRMDERVGQLVEAGAKTRHWDELVVDRSAALRLWICRYSLFSTTTMPGTRRALWRFSRGRGRVNTVGPDQDWRASE